MIKFEDLKVGQSYLNSNGTKRTIVAISDTQFVTEDSNKKYYIWTTAAGQWKEWVKVKPKVKIYIRTFMRSDGTIYSASATAPHPPWINYVYCLFSEDLCVEIDKPDIVKFQ